MSDNKKTRRFVTPNDEVKEMLSGKFDGLLEQTVVKPETEASQKLQQMEKTSAQKIKESLTNKIETLLDLQEKTFTGKYAASKYLGKSISDIMTEERRVNNYIQEIEERLNSLTEEFLAPYRKAGNKTFGWNEERVEIYVENMKQRNLIRSGATDPKEIEAHKKYMELKEEGVVFECRTPLTKLYPAIYKGCTSVEGKTFVFNRGENQNRYITSDSEEIKILREFINQRVDAEFTEVKE